MRLYYYFWLRDLRFFSCYSFRFSSQTMQKIRKNFFFSLHALGLILARPCPARPRLGQMQCKLCEGFDTLRLGPHILRVELEQPPRLQPNPAQLLNRPKGDSWIFAFISAWIHCFFSLKRRLCIPPPQIDPLLNPTHVVFSPSTFIYGTS